MKEKRRKINKGETEEWQEEDKQEEKPGEEQNENNKNMG